MRGPVACVAAVTYRCNGRCTMCDIWKRPPEAERELAPADYAWLPASLRSVNVSGGEPFLRDDLPDVVRVMRESCRRARIVVSTNGLEPDRIARMAAAMKGIAVRVSVDAVGPTHDAVRGVDGAFERAVETVRRLSAAGVRDLGIAATSTERTTGQLTAVERLASELGVAFIASVAHSSPIYFGNQDESRPSSDGVVEEISSLVRRQLRSKRPADWAKAYYARGLIEYVRRRPRMLPCGAGEDHFFLDPYGDVYPCNVQGTRMGNVREGSFAELAARSRDLVRERVAGCREQCWMVCTVSPPMRRHPLRPVAWIAAAKLFGRDAAGGPWGAGGRQGS
ncbi:MAG: radical SAM protein [Candidatus Eisenbacteria bacterium]|nr:radical SAM protein [Candidatus Eisenbacteria bacterium]